MRRSVPVTIAGQHYVLRSDADEDYVREVAALVDAGFARARATTRTVVTHKLAILTALHMADELLRERRRRTRLRAGVRARARRILELLERAAEAET